MALVSPLRDSPAFLTRLAQLAAFEEFHAVYAGSDFTPARFAVFILIARNPGVRPGAIAEELRIKPSNVAAIVNILVAGGLVERHRDEAELRANRLVPTARGRATFETLWSAHDAVDAAFTAALTDAERLVLVGLLRKLDRGRTPPDQPPC